MITVTKEFSWGMSHRLENHTGLCFNVHGHNYKLLVEVSQRKNLTAPIGREEQGMVIDFTRLKELVNTNIIEYFDHSFCYNITDITTKKIAEFLKETINQKLAPLVFTPTVENLAKWCFNKLTTVLLKTSIKIESITIYETDSSFTTYRSG